MVSKLDHTTAAAHQNAAPPLNCPRCDSTNTKFCYYNNYSLAQPRHFCKSCKRYWTRGGTLRNVPVGGSCRKNKRAKKSHHATPAAAAASTILQPPSIIHTPAADLNSLLFCFPPPMMNPSTAFFPKFELDAPHAGYEETFASCLSAAAAAPADFLGDYSMMNPQIPSSSPLMSYDDLNIAKDRETNSFAASGGGAAVGQSYLYWNQAMSGGWPESGSSVAPLI